jgi:hypothetical protein
MDVVPTAKAPPRPDAIPTRIKIAAAENAARVTGTHRRLAMRGYVISGAAGFFAPRRVRRHERLNLRRVRVISWADDTGVARLAVIESR